jgi:hypothetical protein
VSRVGVAVPNSPLPQSKQLRLPWIHQGARPDHRGGHSHRNCRSPRRSRLLLFHELRGVEPRVAEPRNVKGVDLPVSGPGGRICPIGVCAMGSRIRKALSSLRQSYGFRYRISSDVPVAGFLQNGLAASKLPYADQQSSSAKSRGLPLSMFPSRRRSSESIVPVSPVLTRRRILGAYVAHRINRTALIQPGGTTNRRRTRCYALHPGPSKNDCPHADRRFPDAMARDAADGSLTANDCDWENQRLKQTAAPMRTACVA